MNLTVGFCPRPVPTVLLAVTALLLAARPLPAAEPTSAELLDALQTALSQEAAANAAAETSGRSGGGNNLSPAFMGFRQAREALARGNDREAAQSIEGYIIANSKSLAVQKAGSDLLARLQTERATREAAALAEIEDAISRAGEAATKAQTARDIDPILASLGKFRTRHNGINGEERPRGVERISAILTQLRTWQDYLAAMEANRPAAARGILGNLSNQDWGIPFIPRSELLARMQALPDPNGRPETTLTPPPIPISPGPPLRELLARLKTLDDIAPVLSELSQHDEQYRREGASASGTLAGELDRLARARALFQAGMPFSLDLMERANGGNPGAHAATVAPLRAAFVRLALPRALGLPESTVIPADESVAVFLRRTLDAAKTAGDWPLAVRVIEANRRLAEASGSSNVTTFNGDGRGLESFLAGRNQEEAGQWMLAVVSYQTALRSGSPDLPTREIGQRLERINREHPAEFRLGMEQYLTPPERPDGPPFFNRRGGYPGPSGAFPGGVAPGAAASTPAPALPVPAVAAPTPVPAKPSPAPSP